MNWLFITNTHLEKLSTYERYAPDLLADPFQRWLHRRYMWLWVYLAHAGLCVAGLRKEGATHGERCGRKRHGGGAEEAASVRAGVLGHGNLTRLYI